MTEETYKKIFETTTSHVSEIIKAQIRESRERSANQSQRDKYYSEILNQITLAINDIISRARQQDPAIQGFYEKELIDLLNRLNKGISGIREDAHRSLGVVAALESVVEKMSEMPSLVEREIEKAKDIQARAAAGELDKPRKPGTRPDKLRDIRNYVEKDNDK
jgi:hypothetical protein